MSEVSYYKSKAKRQESRYLHIRKQRDDLLEMLEAMVQAYKGYGWHIDEAKQLIARVKND